MRTWTALFGGAPKRLPRVGNQFEERHLCEAPCLGQIAVAFEGFDRVGGPDIDAPRKRAGEKTQFQKHLLRLEHKLGISLDPVGEKSARRGVKVEDVESLSNASVGLPVKGRPLSNS